jgi:hypothetical protein
MNLTQLGRKCVKLMKLKQKLKTKVAQQQVYNFTNFIMRQYMYVYMLYLKSS